MKKSRKSKKLNKKALLALSAVSGFLGAATTTFLYNENNSIEKTYYRAGKEKSNGDDFRIVQVSDLHGVEFGKDNIILLNEIIKLHPDLIAVTGDIIYGYEPNPESAVKFLEECLKFSKVAFVTGNHETTFTGEILDTMLRVFENMGVLVLDNETVEFEKDGKKISVTGVGERNLICGNIKPNEEENFSVLLAHIPHFCEFYEQAGYDMVLTGHAHGGQFRLPITHTPFVAPGQGLFPKYTEGSYKVGKTEVFVSRGLGRSVVPYRLFNRPELCVYDISL